MMLFCAWDRRWHKIKHGWESTAKQAYVKMCDLTNNPSDDVPFLLYKVKAENKAEKDSWLPIVYYFLIAAGILSFFLFRLVSQYVTTGEVGLAPGRYRSETARQ